MDFLSVKSKKIKQKSSVTEMLRFRYKYVKYIDFLANKDKI